MINLNLFEEDKVYSLNDLVKKIKPKRIVGTVMINKSGYPMVGFVFDNEDGEEVREYVYFSKRGARKVHEGMKVNDKAFKNFQVRLTNNADGEQRLKITSGELETISTEDEKLIEAWGL